jgi:pimeloyl-ACP methyl ester carboxylesterase
VLPYDEFGLFHENAEEAGLAWDGPPTVRRVATTAPSGHTVSALVWGVSEPELVLVHGGAQNAHTWDTVALALGRPLVAIDLPGHGHSDWRPDHNYTPQAMADDVAAVITALAPNAVALVGMSLGGLTSLAVAAAHPDAVRRLVLVDVTPGVNREKAAEIIAFIGGPETFESFDGILERTVQFNPTRTVSSLRRGILHNAEEQTDGTWKWRYDQLRFGGDDGDARMLVMNQLWAAVDTVPGPLTLLRGSLSPVVDDADVAELQRRRPDAQVVVVDGAGHSIQGDRPIELAAILEREVVVP